MVFLVEGRSQALYLLSFSILLKLKYHFNNCCLFFLAMGKLFGLFFVVNKGVNMVRLDLFFKEYSALDLTGKL